MKRLIGFIGVASILALSCTVLESRAATIENVSETPEYTLENYQGFDFDFDLVVLTPEILTVKDYSYTLVVSGRVPESRYKSLPVPACRSPGGLPKRF